MFDLKDLKKLDREDVLKLIGLQSRRDVGDWVLPAIGLFGAGVLVGAGIGLILAPKTGRELREDIRQKIGGIAEQVPELKAATQGIPSPRNA